MFCPTSLKKLATLLGVLMCALLALDTSWAPVFKEQLAGWSVVLWVSHWLTLTIFLFHCLLRWLNWLLGVWCWVIVELLHLFCDVVWHKECFGNENQRVAQRVLVRFCEKAPLEFGSFPWQFRKAFNNLHITADLQKLFKRRRIHFSSVWRYLVVLKLGVTWYEIDPVVKIHLECRSLWFPHKMIKLFSGLKLSFTCPNLLQLLVLECLKSLQ